jgi:uncharacterized membrane protein
MAGQAIEKVGKGVKQAAERITSGDSPVTDPKRLAIAGVALAAVPLAAERLARVGLPNLSGKVSELGDQAKGKAKSQIKDTVKDATPDSAGELLSGGGMLKGMFGGGDDDGEEDAEGRAAPGHGSGRRMPVQQAIDVAVPVSVAYNHWTQFEDWPDFMHRVENVEQVDDATVSFQVKMWGISKRFEADIFEQRPDERIEWNVTEGYAHTGLVTFHPLSENLTRIDMTLDVQPSNLIDKASRGMRFVKRAVRGDLHRFKAYVELDHDEIEGWRGTIDAGKVKKARGSGSSSRSRGSSRRTSRNGSGAENGSKAKSATSPPSRPRSARRDCRRPTTADEAHPGLTGLVSRRCPRVAESRGASTEEERCQI